jgi:ABC-type transport system involved in cytochrome c biogenesis ATPase subunit
MSRYNDVTQKYEDNPAVEVFIEEIISLYKKHHLMLGHYNGFKVDKLDDEDIKFIEKKIRQASIAFRSEP